MEIVDAESTSNCTDVGPYNITFQFITTQTGTSMPAQLISSCIPEGGGAQKVIGCWVMGFDMEIFQACNFRPLRRGLLSAYREKEASLAALVISSKDGYNSCLQKHWVADI